MFKAFCTIDSEDGYIEDAQATPANESEVKKLHDLVEKMKDVKRLYDDKGYALLNKLISKRRFKVEQTFAILKRIFKFSRASYMTLAKVNGQLFLKAICYNLLRALNKAIDFCYL